jgi:8-oxo-dGTP diphosphatase
VTSYVAGFAFSPGGEKVVLVRKLRPQWQRGRLNAIGGKIEPGELPEQAMAREFAEETGVEIDLDRWQLCVHLMGNDYEVYFFRADIDNPTACRSAEDEEIVIVDTFPISTTTIPNLHWLIPLCLDNLRFPIVVFDGGGTEYDIPSRLNHLINNKET